MAVERILTTNVKVTLRLSFHMWRKNQVHEAIDDVIQDPHDATDGVNLDPHEVIGDVVFRSPVFVTAFVNAFCIDVF